MYEFEALDASGNEIRETIEASSDKEAHLKLREMGYFSTKVVMRRVRHKSMFNEYGAADEKLQDLCEIINSKIVCFLHENNITNPIELRAIANFLENSIQFVFSEKILRFGVNKRKEEKKK